MRKFLQGLLNVSCIATALTFMTNTEVSAQRKIDWKQPDIKYVNERGWSLGFNAGVADMFGDVGTKTVMDHYSNDKYFDEIKAMGGIYGRYTHIPGLSFRLGIAYGTLYATDKWNQEYVKDAKSMEDDYVQRYLRNLDVKTNIWEGSVMVEISPLQLFSNWEFNKVAQWRFQPYLMAGFGAFYYNPRGSNILNFETGQMVWQDLRPLRTEGQGFNKEGYPDVYDQYSFMIPMGVGFRVDLGRKKVCALGLEYNLRYTFTDYLDDVSGKYVDPLMHDIAFLNERYVPETAIKMADRGNEIIPGFKHQAGTFRGDPNNKDMYGTLSLNFLWRINKNTLAWWK